MSLFQQYNVSVPELWRQVTTSLGDGSADLWAHVRCVQSIVSGVTKHVLTIIKTRQPERIPLTEKTYGAARLFEDSVRGDALLSALEGSGDKFTLSLAGLTIPISGSGSTSMESSGNVYTGPLPCHVVDLSSNRNAGEIDWSTPLLRHSLPPFDGLEDALSSWVPWKEFHGQSDARLGHVFVALPVDGPRFGSMRLRDNQLSAQVEGLQGDAGLQLKAVIRNGSERQRVSIDVTSTTAEFDASGAESIQMWLIDIESRILDYYSETAYQCTRQHRLLYPGASTGVDDAWILESIRRGESDRMEFKPYIDPSDKRKMEEVVRTALAFANTHGGDILLGVTDLQELVGVDDDVLKAEHRAAKRPTARSAIARYCTVLRKLLSDRCLPHLEATITPIRVGDRTIVRIQIAGGERGPYTDAIGNHLWVRRGANSVRPIGAEIEDLVQRRVDPLNLIGGRRRR